MIKTPEEEKLGQGAERSMRSTAGLYAASSVPPAGSQEWSGVLAEKEHSVRRLCSYCDAADRDADCL